MTGSFFLNDGNSIPVVGMGTYGLNGTDCVKAVRDAVDVGYRMFDTARMYGNEADVGEAIRSCGVSRDSIYVSSKAYTPDRSYDGTIRAVDSSLEKLGVDSIDLYLIHEPYPESKDMYRALERCRRDGKVRSIGVSNFDAARFEEFVSAVDTVPAVNQIECHPLYQREDEILVMGRRYGTVTECWSPFGAGGPTILENPVVTSIASRHGRSPAQIVLRFLLDLRTVVIPKASTRRHMSENLDLGFELTCQEMDELRSLDTGRSLFGWTDYQGY